MRLASAERESSPEKAPAPESGTRGAATEANPFAGGRGSSGFTELLRALGTESPSPAVAAKETLEPEMRPPAQDSGFTSLLRNLSAQETAITPTANPIKTVQPPVQSFAEEPRKDPVASGSGGFTGLLRAMPGVTPEFGGPQTQTSGPVEAPVAGGAAGAIPASSENKPGAFTQLFSTVGGASANSPSAPVDRGTGDSSRGSAGSFTQMLSLEQQSSPAEPAFHQERRPLPGRIDYGLTPQTVGPAEVGQGPFSPAPLPEAQPIQSTPPGAGVGITRLIQMLDEPAKAPPPRREDAPVRPPPGAGPGVWTQTFASLATPHEPPAPAESAPDCSPPQAQRIGAPASSETSFPPALNMPPMDASPIPSRSSGPSEFTRILDASRSARALHEGWAGPSSGEPRAADLYASTSARRRHAWVGRNASTGRVPSATTAAVARLSDELWAPRRNDPCAGRKLAAAARNVCSGATHTYYSTSPAREAG